MEEGGGGTRSRCQIEGGHRVGSEAGRGPILCAGLGGRSVSKPLMPGDEAQPKQMQTHQLDLPAMGLSGPRFTPRPATGSQGDRCL